MATYNKNINVPAEAKCDEHSEFDQDGFPLPRGIREWVPWWGGTCEQCGKRC